jgi:gliding motility-associated-like protein
VLTATDINTCIRESKATGVITVHDYSFGVIPDDSICGGESITLYASGGINYDWKPKKSLQNPNSPNPIATPDSTTIYSVKIEDQNGCMGEDSLEIKVIPTVIANFEYEKMYDCFDTPILKFTNNSENASQFLWDFGDGNISEDSEPVYQYEESDTVDFFTVTLTSGESFCSNSHSAKVSSVKTFIPNFFSPNNDGKNDVFEIIADDQIALHIYNRWGKLVFESLNYQNNWQAGDLPSGVYFYEIIFNDKNTRCNGWLQVMR